MDCGNLDATFQTSSSQPTSLGGSIVLDNVMFSGITTANVQDSSGTVMAASSTTVQQWFEGNVYSGKNTCLARRFIYSDLRLLGTANGTYMRGAYPSPPTKPSTLLDSSGSMFTRSRPQYNTWESSRRFHPFFFNLFGGNILLQSSCR